MNKKKKEVLSESQKKLAFHGLQERIDKIKNDYRIEQIKNRHSKNYMNLIKDILNEI